MAFSRVDLVKRLITESSNGNGAFVLENGVDGDDVFRRRLWNDLNSFVNDSMVEVHSKLEKIEGEIWGKLIVMERNFRTAKAYLRASAITIDGTKSFFDGNRIGLSQFQNDNRSPKTTAALKALGRGIRIKVDKVGNIWMKKNVEMPICVQVAQYPEPLFLTTEYRKIIDLRNFRDSIIHELDVTATSLDQEKLFKKSIIFIKLGDAIPEKKPLECALWLALIHLVSVDVINAIVQTNNEHSALPTQTSSNGSGDQTSPLSTPSSSQCDNPNLIHYPRNANLQKRRSFNGVSNVGGQNTDSNADDSSASTSSYVPSSASYMTKQSSTKSNSGVARRIFNSQHQYPQRSQSVNNKERTPRTQFRQTSSIRAPSYSSYQDNIQKSPMHYYSKLNNMSASMIQPAEHLPDQNGNNNFSTYKKRPQNQVSNGWSLLNLSEIDKMQKPIYYSSNEEADRGRRAKRGGMGHKFSSQSNLLNEKASNFDDEDLPVPINTRQPGRRSTSRPRLNIKWLSENSLRNLG